MVQVRVAVSPAVTNRGASGGAGRTKRSGSDETGLECDGRFQRERAARMWVSARGHPRCDARFNSACGARHLPQRRCRCGDAVRRERLSACIARLERPTLRPGYGAHAVRYVSGNVARGYVSIKGYECSVSFCRQRTRDGRKPVRVASRRNAWRGPALRVSRVVYPFADIKPAQERGTRRGE